MKLAAAAVYFDRLPVYDAYTGRRLFYGQFDLFDDSKRDAVNVQRRTLSVVPGTALPARFAVKAADQYWITGTAHNLDTFGATAIRDKLTLHRAHGLGTVRTPGQVIGNTGGTSMYFGLAWMKDWKEVEHTSQVFAYYELYVATSETVGADAYIELDGKVFRTRGAYTSEAGFKVLESDDLGATKVTVTVTAPGTYNPATDVISSSSASYPALLVRFAVDFLYEQQSAPKHEKGDVALLVRKTDVPTIKSNDTVTIAGVVHTVLSKQTESDCWNLHVRP